MSYSKWIVPLKALNGKPDLRVFVFPYAGGNVSVFRQWYNYLPPNIELCLVQLPGHGSRINEPIFTRLHALIEELAPACEPYFDLPFAFFGHSMGSLISFELTRYLQKQGKFLPRQLFVSSFEAPHLYNREVKLHKLPNNEFLKKISQLGGTPQSAMEDKELLKLIIPILKADLELCETYKFTDDTRIDCPITGFSGHVDLIVNPENFKAWGERTNAEFKHFMFNGGHFYFQDNLVSFMFKFAQLLNELLFAKTSVNY